MFCPKSDIVLTVIFFAIKRNVYTYNSSLYTGSKRLNRFIKQVWPVPIKAIPLALKCCAVKSTSVILYCVISWFFAILLHFFQNVFTKQGLKFIMILIKVSFKEIFYAIQLHTFPLCGRSA